jgi:phosphinothricin acetyltransferase
VENTVYVRDDCRGKGYGGMILTKLIEDAKASGLWVITAWIDAGNEGSIRFHEKFGFETVGRMPGIGQKRGKRLGVVIMQLDLKGEDEIL